MNRILLSFALILFVSTSAGAQAPKVDRVNIIEYGIYTATPRDEIKEEKLNPHASVGAGRVQPTSDNKLVTKTDTVQARLGLRFGISYVVVGQPNGKEVKLTWITRYPPQGLVAPQGEKIQKDEFDWPAKIGEPTYRSFKFDYPWEMAAGDWSLEFWYQGRKLGEKKFTVATP